MIPGRLENIFIFLIYYKSSIVSVPPKVSPFYAEETLHVGDRTSLTCSVPKGDLPLTISWQKDGRTLDTSPMISITQVDQYTSILLIENLTPEHNGNYSCVVRNLAAEVKHTQQLVVNGNLACRVTRFSISFLSLMFVSLLSQFLLLLSPFPSKTGCQKACEPEPSAALVLETRHWWSPG